MTKSLVKALGLSLLLSVAVKASAQDLQTVYLFTDNNTKMEFMVPAGKIAEIVSGYGQIDILREVDGIYDGRGGTLPLDARSQFPYFICGPSKIRNNDSNVF